MNLIPANVFACKDIMQFQVTMFTEYSGNLWWLAPFVAYVAFTTLLASNIRDIRDWNSAFWMIKLRSI